MSIRFRPAIFGITCLGFIGLCTPISSAQVARTELHAIPTLTLSDRQFLIGDKNGTSVTIAGVLRGPRVGLPTAASIGRSVRRDTCRFGCGASETAEHES